MARAEKAATDPRLPFRVIVQRHVWTTAETALKRSKAAFLASATEDARAVLVQTTKRGRAALQAYALDPAAMIDQALEPGPPPPPPKAKPVDPFDAAFAELRDRARAEQTA